MVLLSSSLGRRDALCSSGFMDDVIFVHGRMPIPLQRVTSLRRRALANAPVASYWLYRAQRAPRLDEFIVQGGGACTAQLPCCRRAGAV